MNYKLMVKMEDGELIYPKGLYFTVVIPSNTTFLQLHKIIMACTNYEDYHMWSFAFDNHYEVKIIDENDIRMRERPYKNMKYPDLLEAKEITIKELLTEYKVARYTYDFGDDNHFQIELLEYVEDDNLIGVIDFNGKFPPEDIGGIHGYLDFLKIQENLASATEEQIEMVNHFESMKFEAFNVEKSSLKVKKIIKKA